jgi:hypothetical protein
VAAEPRRGEALARALASRGSATSAEQAALLADFLLSLCAQGLLVTEDQEGPHVYNMGPFDYRDRDPKF